MRVEKYEEGEGVEEVTGEGKGMGGLRTRRGVWIQVVNVKCT